MLILALYGTSLSPSDYYYPRFDEIVVGLKKLEFDFLKIRNTCVDRELIPNRIISLDDLQSVLKENFARYGSKTKHKKNHDLLCQWNRFERSRKSLSCVIQEHINASMLYVLLNCGLDGSSKRTPSPLEDSEEHAEDLETISKNLAEQSICQMPVKESIDRLFVGDKFENLRKHIENLESTLDESDLHRQAIQSFLNAPAPKNGAELKEALLRLWGALPSQKSTLDNLKIILCLKMDIFNIDFEQICEKIAEELLHISDELET